MQLVLFGKRWAYTFIEFLNNKTLIKVPTLMDSLNASLGQVVGQTPRIIKTRRPQHDNREKNRLDKAEVLSSVSLGNPWISQACGRAKGRFPARIEFTKRIPAVSFVNFER